jgi:hypothetical protein
MWNAQSHQIWQKSRPVAFNLASDTPDGRFAVSGSWDNTLRAWDLKDGKEPVILTLDGYVSACIAAPDSRTIIAGDDFTARTTTVQWGLLRSQNSPLTSKIQR